MPFSRRKPDLGADRGISLVELLVATALALIVLAAVGGMFVSLASTPKTVTSRFEEAGNAQTLANSIDRNVRNSSDFRLTNPVGQDQLLVARTALSDTPITWICTAWYYSASDGTVRYDQSSTAISLAPTADELASWTVLDVQVAPSSGTGIFTVSGQEVFTSFTAAVTGQSTPQTISTSAYSRAGSTGSPACY
jgi:Tfp pilus assembly protein PilW